ncbi:Uncharacterised protein [Corynebacterium renale]|nr:Uncharacterised protein [Corynebacterium renale]
MDKATLPEVGWDCREASILQVSKKRDLGKRAYRQRRMEALRQPAGFPSGFRPGPCTEASHSVNNYEPALTSQVGPPPHEARDLGY